MPEVRVRSNESFEHALRRFINTCKREGVIADMKSHRHFEKPSEKKKRKAKAARRRLMKKSSRERTPATERGGR
jgi:small subunit ribosomal protein S21